MAEIPVPYEYDGRQFEGRLVYDDSIATPRPAIFMQPDWLGVCSHSVAMAQDVAGDDYVVMVADMFGADYRGMERAQEQLGKVARATRADIGFILGCGNAAVAAMTAEADRLGLIDSEKLGAIGYCMGGGFLLEQVRNGAAFKGSVVIHVTLPITVAPDRTLDIKGRILAIHGAEDTITPKPQIDTLEAELTGAGADWQVMMFGHALHSFCIDTADSATQKYDERLCKQSYRMMRDFFSEIF